MRTTDFQTFYRSNLVSVFESLEAERKKIIKIVNLAIATGLAVIVISITISMFSDEPEVAPVPFDPYANRNMGPQQVNSPNAKGGSVFFYVIVIGGLGYYFWFLPKKKSLKTRFKTELISKLVKFVDEGLTFHPEQGISRTDYLQSGIFLTTGDRYTSEDLVSGTIGKTAIRFSEVHTETENKSEDSSSNKNTLWTSYSTLYKGILFIADFNKHFKGRTVVLSDQAERAFGSLGTMLQKMNQKRDPLIKLDDPEFEKAFAVYGTDPVEAHYILSPALMERILTFKGRAGNIELSFTDSKIYIAIPYRENLFEANIFSPITSYSKLESYNYHLQLVAGIVEELNLNNRIWTKE